MCCGQSYLLNNVLCVCMCVCVLRALLLQGGSLAGSSWTMGSSPTTTHRRMCAKAARAASRCLSVRSKVNTPSAHSRTHAQPKASCTHIQHFHTHTHTPVWICVCPPYLPTAQPTRNRVGVCVCVQSTPQTVVAWS